MVLDALNGVTRSGALDRLIRGRIWIAVIAFALIGIVALQLLVLQLNANIGRTLAREAQLQRENAALSIEGSELASGERVESKAALLGMQLVPVGSLRFLRSDPRADIARAAAALNTPVHSASSSSSSGEAGTATANATSATAASAADSEQTTNEASAPVGGEAASVGAEASSGAGTTPSSVPTPTGTAASLTPASATTGAPTESATTGTTGVVGGAGGVGTTQANGAG